MSALKFPLIQVTSQSDDEHSDDESSLNLSFDLDDEEFQQSAGNAPFEINSDFRHTDLQAQLMTVVLENEKLTLELEQTKHEEVKGLSDKLRAEQDKRRVLEEQLLAKIAVQRRRQKFANLRSDNLYKSNSMGNLADPEVDTASISVVRYDSDPEITQQDPSMNPDLQRSSLVSHRSPFSVKLKIWLSNMYDELIDDLSEVKTEIGVTKIELEQLSPSKLKKNLVRLGHFLDLIEEFRHLLGSITRWENPAASFMTFTVYMVIIYKDWFLSTIFLSIIAVFLFTYLRHKGWVFGNEGEYIMYSSTSEIEKNLSIREQISVITNVNRRSQNHAGMAADALEKIRNVLLWREPELTKPVVIFLVQLSGLGIGIHVFIIQYVFSRFPRFNKKYNKVDEFISQLKNDAEYELEIKKIKKDMKKTPKKAYSLSATQSISTLTLTSDDVDSSSLKPLETPEIITPASFHDTFRLPISETPVSPWKNGRRCILVGKEKYFAVGFKIGRMYLTNNYLCFERSKTVRAKNVIIPLETIQTITKAKLYQWVPGGGKAIEIKTEDTRKPLVFVFQVHIFGPIVNRDEAFDSIMKVGVTNEYVWAETHFNPLDGNSRRSPVRRSPVRRSPVRRSPVRRSPEE
uniref:GRAM domain-containing protein n=1 Tax=Strigamia maritima TaxID=126957 RepID=T1IHT6_STRMM